MSSSPSAQLEYFLSCSNLGILTRKMVGSCCYYTTKRRETRFVLLLCFNIIRGLFYVRYCVVEEESPRRCSVIKLSSVAMSTLASQRPTKHIPLQQMHHQIIVACPQSGIPSSHIARPTQLGYIFCD